MIDRERALGRLFMAAFFSLMVASFGPQIRLPGMIWAIVLLVYSVGASITALVLAGPLAIRARIIALAIAYIGITVSFGSLHYFLFLRHPQAYAFADSISAAQRRNTIDAARGEAQATAQEATIISKVVLKHEIAFHTLQKGLPFVLEDGSSITLSAETIVSPPAIYHTYNLVINTSVQKYSISGDIIGDPKSHLVMSLFHANNSKELKGALEELNTALVEDHQKALAILSSESPVWGYGEFLYLSAITMTTLGMGDIIPTSSGSRFLIGAEAMSGVLLIAFALAFFWPDPPQETQ